MLAFAIREYNMCIKNRLKTGTVDGPWRKAHPPTKCQENIFDLVNLE